MAYTVNKIIVIGKAGKDAESGTTKSGKKYLRFSVATSEYAGKGEDGKTKYATTWHNVQVWQRGESSALVDRLAETVKKGSTVYVEGALEIQQVEEKTYVKINANEVVVLGDRSAQSETATDSAPSPKVAAAASASSSKAAPPPDFEDIPF